MGRNEIFPGILHYEQEKRSSIQKLYKPVTMQKSPSSKNFEKSISQFCISAKNGKLYANFGPGDREETCRLQMSRIHYVLSHFQKHKQ